MSIINVRELTKTYSTYKRGSSLKDAVKSLFVRERIWVEALKGISFSVEEGEMLGFLGPNGAGKSTTLKILTGVLYPTSGQADVMGFVPWRQRKKYVAGIGAVFGQKSQLIWDIPPMDSFEMNRAIYDIAVCDYRERLSKMVELLDAGGVINKPTRQLSLGERMKCEFIMAMLHNPRIVFLDEPTIGLDVIAKERTREFITEMNRAGVTFILTTHDLNDVEKVARRVIVVNHGEVVCDDSITGLRSHFGNKKLVNLTVARPIGEPESREGIRIIAVSSPFNIELELDAGKLELNRFIKEMDERFLIVDMTIGQPNIESIIKEFYIGSPPYKSVI